MVKFSRLGSITLVLQEGAHAMTLSKFRADIQAATRIS